MPVDLLTPVIDLSALHPSFRAILELDHFIGARKMLEQVGATYHDKDGHFVREFQTAGFDARVWELYLHAALVEAGFALDPSHAAPDFIATKRGVTCGIEAVTVNPTQGGPREDEEPAETIFDVESFLAESENAHPIKFGSSLRTKMQKRYWEKEYMRGKPFVLAIADFHDTASMCYTEGALSNYLYGYRHRWSRGPDGELLIFPQKIGRHVQDQKEIPAGFFDLPSAANVSAVLFSSAGTISKFNRMGWQAGHAPARLVMIRHGAWYDHDPEAEVPIPFAYEVGGPEALRESWGQGLAVYHNPNATVPVPPKLFPDASEHRRRPDGQIESAIPPVFPCSSQTTTCPRIFADQVRSQCYATMSALLDRFREVTRIDPVS